MDVEAGQWTGLLEKITDLSQMWCWKRAGWLPWSTRKTNQGGLEQVNTETSLQAKITKPKSSDFWHIMRRWSSLEKTIILGKNRRKQEKKKTKYEESWLRRRSHRPESTGAEQELRTGHYGCHSFTGVTRSRSRLNSVHHGKIDIFPFLNY